MLRLNPPPGWPATFQYGDPVDPSWPPAPPGWTWWLEDTSPLPAPQPTLPAQQQSPMFQPVPVYSGYGHDTSLAQRTVTVPIAWLVALITLGYMLPWAIAASRGKSNAGAIGGAEPAARLDRHRLGHRVGGGLQCASSLSEIQIAKGEV